jgi:hypothetical protein
MGNWIKASHAVFVAFIAIVAAAVVWWGMWKWNYDGEKTIRAGEIEVVFGGLGSHGQPLPNAIKGSFTLSTPMLKLGTIRSQGTGGACLVANLNPYRVSGVQGGCSKNSDCQGGLNGWAGYCDGVTGICWIRPGGDEFCNKSNQYPGFPPGKIWVDGVKNLTPKDGPHSFQELSSAPVEWRVLACLNGIDPDTGKDTTDCKTGGPRRIEVFGKIKSVPYKPF